MADLKRNISKFYLFSFFHELMFTVPVIVPFWQSNGLTLTQIMILQSIFALSWLLSEVPTGVVADKIGRKQSLICGAITLLIATIVYMTGYGFIQFAIAEIIWGIGNGFLSGADSAFVYETLKKEKKEKDYKKVWGNAKSINYAAAGLAAIVGGFIAVYSLRFNWVLLAFAFVAMTIIAFTFKEPKHYMKLDEEGYLKHAWESFKIAVKNKPLLFLVLFYAALSTVSRIALWFYQPYMQQSGIAIGYFGLIWASFSIVAIAASKSAHKIEKAIGEKMSLMLIILGMILSLIFMSWWFAIFGIVFIFMQQFVRGFSPPILSDYTNKLLTRKKRATLLSIQSFAASLGFTILGPIFGYIADKFSLSTALLTTAISFAVIFGLLMLWKTRIKR